MFLLRRILFLIPLLLVISGLSFTLLRLAPGGPFDHERAPASPETERLLRERYHLDDPVGKQYARWLSAALHGDLGLSLKYRNHTVNDIIRQGLPVSLSLGLLAFGFALGVGVPVGFYTAVRRGHWADWGGSFLVLLSICVPGFVIGPLLAMLFALKVHWFPAALWGSPAHVVLPMITLGLYFAGRVARLMREGMTQTLQSEFIRTARAKGLSEFAVLTRHAFRLAVMPVVSYSGPMLADLLTGSFVVESIFQIPGIGVFIVDSSRSRDYPLVIGLVLLYAVLLLGLNLLVDLAYGLLDPRVKYE
jgi:oligopeptide transport system permease protein